MDKMLKKNSDLTKKYLLYNILEKQREDKEKMIERQESVLGREGPSISDQEAYRRWLEMMDLPEDAGY
jgi:hypothetical protein